MYQTSLQGSSCENSAWPFLYFTSRREEPAFERYSSTLKGPEKWTAFLRLLRLLGRGMVFVATGWNLYVYNVTNDATGI
jgi:hypothetical protein